MRFFYSALLATACYTLKQPENLLPQDKTVLGFVFSGWDFGLAWDSLSREQR